MKDKIKSYIALISIFGVLFGRFLNRVLSNYFGDSASIIIVAVILTITLSVILVIFIMKYYFEAISLFFMSIPLIILFIGLYLNNIIVAGIGILSFFVIYPILIMIISRIKRDR